MLAKGERRGGCEKWSGKGAEGVRRGGEVVRREGARRGVCASIKLGEGHLESALTHPFIPHPVRNLHPPHPPEKQGMYANTMVGGAGLW